MPTYKYKTTIKGKVQSGEIEAEDEQGAIAKLKQRNIAVTSVKKKFESAFLSNKKPITERDIVIFTRQFSTMVDAGLPLVQCLEILGKQADNPSFGEVIMKVKVDIESGSNLSDAMRKHPKVFNSLYTNLVEAGEAGGILDTILGRLANYIEKSDGPEKESKIRHGLSVSHCYGCGYGCGVSYGIRYSHFCHHVFKWRCGITRTYRPGHEHQ